PGSRSPGTPLYMAPEQIDSAAYGPVTPAADIYAVGVMLYHMISGRPPFLGTMTDIFNGHLNFTPKPCATASGDPLDPVLWGAIERAMAKRPADRFASADEAIAALEAARIDPGEPALPPPAPPTAADTATRDL
ncbi:MAG: serine/threonine protein kinase, partial [Planctomycetota bacterium]|nr:serine/threonine protein kinase [Planctomycetota bacterium]